MAVSKANVLTALGNFKTLQDTANAEKFVAKEEGKQLSSNDFSDLDKAKLDGLKNYPLPAASKTVLGGVKVGTGLEMDSNNALNCTITTDTLPEASATGKGLISAADKAKLDSIENNAQENVIERISLDGTVQTVTNKTAVLNMSAYAKKTDIASGVRVKGAVNSYTDLPANAETGDLYNIRNAGGVDGEGVSIQAGDNVIRTANGTWDVLAGMTDFSNFVEKEDGKGLSTNDFTDTEKTKLASLNNYTLPTASETEKGGFIVGEGLSMAGDTLNVTMVSGETYDTFTGASASSAGLSGLVPAPSAGDEEKYLRGDGNWVTLASGTATTINTGTILNCTVTAATISGDAPMLVLPDTPATVDCAIWIEPSEAPKDNRIALIPTTMPTPVLNGSIWIVD